MKGNCFSFECAKVDKTNILVLITVLWGWGWHAIELVQMSEANFEVVLPPCCGFQRLNSGCQASVASSELSCRHLECFLSSLGLSGS